MATWGIVSTIKAELPDILNFAAWHLHLGAHRIYLHLDVPDDRAMEILSAHPRIRPVVTGPEYWKRLGRARPAKHQVRQTVNASRVYARRDEVDWLAHIDVDEFLIPDKPLSETLDALPRSTQVARMRPMENLAPLDTSGPVDFKLLNMSLPERRRLSTQVWPTFGPYLNGGFLSHVAGKIFVRTSLPEPEFRIHNFRTAGQENPSQVELQEVALAHLHYENWESWLRQYRFRHDKGSYRSELKPAQPRERGGMTLHDLFAHLEQEQGDAGLKAFFDEVCAATPEHIARLQAAGLHRALHLPLAEVRETVFPGIA
ncbi:glycosyltransferase family 2 protein [Pseudooceanicola sp. C21-150M6]|uniref:glycosyltransferase family 2 protein n=1 Tax=Pseudooceanicola sp. C21-150M6 TaxID=3434355 RepID=UPI003D7FDE03